MLVSGHLPGFRKLYPNPHRSPNSRSILQNIRLDNHSLGDLCHIDLRGGHAARGYPPARGSRLRRVYRTLLILPSTVPAILSILILKGTFNQDFGVANQLLRGIFGFAPEWETNPWAARTMVLLVNLWLGYPYMMLICMGMLQSIPSAIYEASAIDGSNRIVDFFQITLPLVLSPMIPILISSFAFNFNNFQSYLSPYRWRSQDGRRRHRGRDRSACELHLQYRLS